MSPWDVVEFGILVVDGDVAIQGLMELNLCTGEAEALGVWGDLEAESVPLHDVVLADDAFVVKAADAVEVFGCDAPGFLGVARSAREAAIVIGDEGGQELIGGVEIGDAGEAKFAGEAVLQSSPEAFDAALGLRSLRGDIGDAELLESAAELRGILAAAQLLFPSPVIVVANKDAVPVAVETERNAVTAQQPAQQAEVAAGVFTGKKLGDQKFAGGIVEEAEQSELRATALEPVVAAGVEQQHLAFARTAEATLAMSGSAAFPGRAQSGGAQQLAHGFAMQGEALDLMKFLGEVMIVEPGIDGAG